MICALSVYKLRRTRAEEFELCPIRKLSLWHQFAALVKSSLDSHSDQLAGVWFRVRSTGETSGSFAFELVDGPRIVQVVIQNIEYRPHSHERIDERQCDPDDKGKILLPERLTGFLPMRATTQQGAETEIDDADQQR